KHMLQVSRLDPQPCARGAGDGGQPGRFRQSQPGVPSERLTAFFETSIEHERFKTAGNVEHNAGVCVPFLDAHVFPAIVEQGDEPHTLPSYRRHGVDESRVDVDVRAVGGIELKQLPEDGAARLRPRRMARGRRIADVAPRRTVAALVLKDSLKNEKFFTAEMRVRREGGAWRVANDGRCTRDLVTDAVEHSALDTRHWRAHPVR